MSSGAGAAQPRGPCEPPLLPQRLALGSRREAPAEQRLGQAVLLLW